MQHGNTQGSVQSLDTKQVIALGNTVLPAQAYNVRGVTGEPDNRYRSLIGLLECARCYNRADDRDCSILLIGTLLP